MATFVDETQDGGGLDITAPGEPTESKKGSRPQNAVYLRCGVTTDFMEH